MMKIVVDLKLCEGNQRCATAASEVFEVRDDRAHVLIENPPTGLIEKECGWQFGSVRALSLREK